VARVKGNENDDARNKKCTSRKSLRTREELTLESCYGKLADSRPGQGLKSKNREGSKYQEGGGNGQHHKSPRSQFKERTPDEKAKRNQQIKEANTRQKKSSRSVHRNRCARKKKQAAPCWDRGNAYRHLHKSKKRALGAAAKKTRVDGSIAATIGYCLEENGRGVHEMRKPKLACTLWSNARLAAQIPQELSNWSTRKKGR